MRFARQGLMTAAMLLGCAGAAHATVSNDASLVSPGVYYGTGNSGENSHFTVDSENNIEIGLEAIDRFVGNIAPTSGNTYNVALGNTIDGRSVWGVTFSINLRAGGGSLGLSDVVTGLTLQDVAKGTSTLIPFDVRLIPDNGEVGTSGTCNDITKCSPPTNPYGLQNSETLSFASVATILGDPLFDDTINDTYIFTLDVHSVTGLPLGSDTINVVAGSGAPVPEPITISLFGAGLAGLVALRRRRKA